MRNTTVVASPLNVFAVNFLDPIVTSANKRLYLKDNQTAQARFLSDSNANGLDNFEFQVLDGNTPTFVNLPGVD